MKLSELTPYQLNLLAYNYPKYLAKYYITYMVDKPPKYTKASYMPKYFPSFMAKYFPNYMAKYLPEYMAEHHPGYMVRYHPNYMVDNYPKYMVDNYPKYMVYYDIIPKEIEDFLNSKK